MSAVNPSLADFEKLIASIPAETPVTSHNLLRFRKWADYPSNSTFEPCSGLEAYARYLKIVSERVNAVGGKVEWMTDVLGHLTSPKDERWDAVVLVSYPSFKAFLSMLSLPSNDYEGPIHRNAALEDVLTILIRTPNLK